MRVRLILGTWTLVSAAALLWTGCGGKDYRLGDDEESNNSESGSDSGGDGDSTSTESSSDKGGSTDGSQQETSTASGGAVGGGDGPATAALAQGAVGSDGAGVGGTESSDDTGGSGMGGSGMGGSGTGGSGMGGSGTGGSGGFTANVDGGSVVGITGGSITSGSGVASATGGGEFSCSAMSDGCQCFHDEECAVGERCYLADCQQLQFGVCHASPDEGCVSYEDCATDEVCVGAFLPSCSANGESVVGTCEIDPCPGPPECKKGTRALLSDAPCSCFDGESCQSTGTDVGRCRDLEGSCYACR
jgi:hypothetical protein